MARRQINSRRKVRRGKKANTKNVRSTFETSVHEDEIDFTPRDINDTSLISLFSESKEIEDQKNKKIKKDLENFTGEKIPDEINFMEHSLNITQNIQTRFNNKTQMTKGYQKYSSGKRTLNTRGKILIGLVVVVFILILVLAFSVDGTGDANSNYSSEETSKENKAAPVDLKTVDLVTDNPHIATTPYENTVEVDSSEKDSFLVNINKKYFYDPSFEPAGLVNTTVKTSGASANARHKIRGDIDESVNALFEASLESGFKFLFVSGYRSYGDQEALYKQYLKSDGQEDADTYSARAGYSEHQTGLAFDVTTMEFEKKELHTLNGTQAAAWLKDNAYKYGFIIRYPEDKVDVTKYVYESWHLRYVGIEPAKIMYENNWTLEEYLFAQDKKLI